jgi:hypothetical protein
VSSSSSSSSSWDDDDNEEGDTDDPSTPNVATPTDAERYLKELEDEHTFSDDTIEVLRAFVMQQ